MTSTMRTNKREFPSILTEPKGREIYSNIFLFTPLKNCLPPVTLQSYITKRRKPLIFLSTFFQNSNLVPNSSTNLSIINQSYNKFKCGIDVIDQTINSYTVRRRTNRWPMNLFYFILDVAITNSYTLCKNLDILSQNCQKREFMERLGLEICLQNVINRDFTRLDSLHKNDAKMFVERYNYVFSKSVELSFLNLPLRPINLESNTIDKDYCVECLDSGHLRNRLSKVKTSCSNCKKFICKGHSINVCKNCINLN